MNKKAIYALTAIALQSVIFQSANADSTVRITSNITASPCTVDTTSSDINLGVMTASYLNNPSLNKASEYTLPLVIKLIGCPETTTSVSATFSGTPSTQNSSYYKNTSGNAGDAAAMDVEFDRYTEGTGDRELLKNGSMIRDLAIENGEASFAVVARMINSSSSTTIGAGDVSTAISINFSYK